MICLPQAAGPLPDVRKVPQGALLWQALPGAGLGGSQGQLQSLMLILPFLSMPHLSEGLALWSGVGGSVSLSGEHTCQASLLYRKQC